jgi:hypothetical protein
MAPVTDWRYLSEFEAVRDNPLIETLALHHLAADLAWQPIFIAISNCDHRVNSAACVSLVADILHAEAREPGKPSRLNFMIDHKGEGHGLTDPTRVIAAEYLLSLSAV